MSVSQIRTREDRKGGALMILWDDKREVEVVIASLKLNHEVVIMILVYFSVKDQKKNQDIKININAVIEKYQTEEDAVIPLGDLIEHIEFNGEQQSNKKGQIILSRREGTIWYY